MANFKTEQAGASFLKGWLRVPQGDAETVKQEIKDALHVGTRQTFYNRLNGLVQHRPSEKAAIEKVFEKYGITDIWD